MNEMQTGSEISPVLFAFIAAFLGATVWMLHRVYQALIDLTKAVKGIKLESPKKSFARRPVRFRAEWDEDEE